MFGYIIRLGKARGSTGPETKRGCRVENLKMNGISVIGGGKEE